MKDKRGISFIATVLITTLIVLAVAVIVLLGDNTLRNTIYSYIQSFFDILRFR